MSKGNAKHGGKASSAFTPQSPHRTSTSTGNMCSITNKNFNEKFDEIINEISVSDFIAVDCEFSGLSGRHDNKSSLFDNPSEGYIKFRKGIEDYVAFQIGITSFTYKQNEKYEASTYTFHLFPRSHSGSDVFFLCEARSIQFLSEQKFDFNKVFHDGITYRRVSDEATLKNDIDDGSLVSSMRSEMSRADRDVMRELCRRVSQWSPTAGKGDTITLDVTGIDPFTIYLIRDEIETQFPFSTTHHRRAGAVVVEHTGTQDVRQLPHLREELFALSSGFTRLLKEVIAMKKPIIGHNMFTDLSIIYKMFIGPLPEDYQSFKKEITRSFPEVYDTKYLSAQMKKLVHKKYLWSMNTLPYLYKYFHEGKGLSIVPDLPVIEYKSFTETSRSEQSHDSGFDSYCTGYVFLNLSYIFSMWDPEESKFRSLPAGNGPPRCFSAIRDKRNKLNLMRSYLDHISLDGPDPEWVKPDFIEMESRTGDIDLTELSKIISKYDRADIKQLTSRRAVIAPSTRELSKIIRRQLRKHRKYAIVKNQPKPQNNAVFRKGAIVLTLGGIGIATFLWYKNAVSGRGTPNLWEANEKVPN